MKLKVFKFLKKRNVLIFRKCQHSNWNLFIPNKLKDINLIIFSYKLIKIDLVTIMIKLKEILIICCFLYILEKDRGYIILNIFNQLNINHYKPKVK